MLRFFLTTFKKTVENINENNQILESMALTSTVPVCDSQIQTDPSTSFVSTTSQGCCSAAMD